jgi:hypothetical protein
MAEIIAANLDGLKTPALDHFKDRAVDTADGWKTQYAAIGSPLRHGARGDIDKSAEKLCNDAGSGVQGIMDAIVALADADTTALGGMVDMFTATEEDRVTMAGGSGSTNSHK